VIPHDGGWRHRDDGVQAFNDDLPFDRFLTEQIAGDALVDRRKAATFTPETLRLLTATGFLRTGDDHIDADQCGIGQSHIRTGLRCGHRHSSRIKSAPAREESMLKKGELRGSTGASPGKIILNG
jgi:hypothetical protein